MTEPDKPTLEPKLELLVRDLIEARVSHRLSGYSSILKYSIGVATAVFAILGLKTCSDIEATAKDTYAQQLQRRLDAKDTSSEIVQYGRRLTALYKRALLDAALVRIDRARRHFRNDRFEAPRLPAEESTALLDIALGADTSDNDFRDAMLVLQQCSAISDDVQCNNISSSLAEALDGKSRSLRVDRRAATIRVLAKLNHRGAAREIRKLLSDLTASDMLRISAASYVASIGDTEALEGLSVMVQSDNTDLSTEARVALAVIQPDHKIVKDWIASLSAKSTLNEIAGALQVAANISRVSDLRDRRSIPLFEESRSKWASDAGELFDTALAKGLESSFGLSSSRQFDDDDDWNDAHLPSLAPSNILLQMRDGYKGLVISSWLLVGSVSRVQISKVLDHELTNPSLHAAKIMRFFGATTALNHLTEVVITLSDKSIARLTDGRTLDKSSTTELVCLTDPAANSATILVYWRDVAGQSQNAQLMALKDAEQPRLRFHQQ